MPTQNSTPSFYDQQELLDRARFPRFAGTIPDGISAKGANLSCGDEVTLSLLIESGVIIKARHTTRGCAICTAGADLLCQALEGTSATDSFPQITIDGLSPSRIRCKEVALEALAEVYSLHERDTTG